MHDQVAAPIDDDPGSRPLVQLQELATPCNHILHAVNAGCSRASGMMLTAVTCGGPVAAHLLTSSPTTEHLDLSGGWIGGHELLR